MLTLEQENQISDIFTSYIEESKNKNNKEGLWRIKLDGNFLITRNNKTSWTSLEYAKLALYMHFKPCDWYVKNVSKNKNISFDLAKEYYDKLFYSFLNSGRIEFIKIENGSIDKTSSIKGTIEVVQETYDNNKKQIELEGLSHSKLINDNNQLFAVIQILKRLYKIA